MTATIPPSVSARLDELGRLIGDTPLMGIAFHYKGRNRVIHAKCEHLNLTGSIKDRMALHILRSAYEHGHLCPGDRIVEATSGNTGISFAALARALGHPVTIYMPDWMSTERKQLIASYGARIALVSRDDGGFLGSIRIQGISDEFIPAIVHLAEIDRVISVPDGDAILMAQKLACTLGLGVGISSGCNFLSAVMAQEELGWDATVVTVFADDNKKYLSTGLFREEPVKPGYLAPEIELTGIRVLPRSRGWSGSAKLAVSAVPKASN